MKISSRLLSAALIASAVLLNGCGSSGSGTTASHSVDVTPSLGLVTGATVNLYQSDGTTLLGTASIGPDGSVSIDYSGSYAGPIVVEIVGNANAQYYDEALSAMAPFGAGSTLHAIVPSGVTQVGVTALTEIAWQIAQTQSLGLTDQTITDINQRVRSALAPEISDILAVPRLYDSNVTGGSLGDSDADRYALRLAALAYIGNDNNSGGDPAPALRAIRQLAQDLADGTLDGQADGSTIADLAYTAGSLAATFLSKMDTVAQAVGSSALQTVINNFATNYGNAAGDIDLSNLSSGSGGNSGGGNGCDTTCLQLFADHGGVTDAFVPDTSSLKDALTTEFDGATTYDVTIGSNGTITLNGDTTAYEFAVDEITGYEIAANETNIYYTDSATGYKVIFQATDSGLSLNMSEPYTSGADINTLDNATLNYSDGAGSNTTLTPDGDGAALSGGNGATATVGSTTYTYTDAGAVAPAYSYISTNNTGDFFAYGGNAITQWRVVGFPAAVGTYSCGTGGNLPEVRLTLNGIPYSASTGSGTCTIEVTSVSTTEVEGRFAATLVDASGNVFGTTTDGYFRYVNSGGGSSGNGGLASGVYGAYMEVDGTAVEWTDVPALDGYDFVVSGYLNLGNAPALQLRFIPQGQTGTYTCGQGPNSYRLVGIWYGNYRAEQGVSGSSCTIDVTSAGAVYEGTFSATLVNPSNSADTITITNGQFRNDGSQL